MDITEFTNLFDAALKLSLESAEKAQGCRMDTPTAFEVHAPNSSEELVGKQEAIKLIYIGENEFFKIIDISVIERDGQFVGFVRVSGHRPVSVEETYDPSDLGPFKPA